VQHRDVDRDRAPRGGPRAAAGTLHTGRQAQTGLFAFACVALITRDAPYAYVNPVTGREFADPISVWYHFFSPSSAPIDRSGSTSATCLGQSSPPRCSRSRLGSRGSCTRVESASWSCLVFSRRVASDLLVPLGLRLPAGQCPTWSSRRCCWPTGDCCQAHGRSARLLGLGAGLLAVGLRSRGYGIEAAFITVAGFQAVMRCSSLRSGAVPGCQSVGGGRDSCASGGEPPGCKERLEG